MTEIEDSNDPPGLATSLQVVQPLHQLCREGKLYEVEYWIAEKKPLQVAPEAIAKRTKPKTALQIALETGQYSLVTLLLRNGYRLDLERYRPLELALELRRWDLFDLLLEAGEDLRNVDVYTVLDTYNVSLYERCMTANYDLTQRHEMAAILGHRTSNRPLLGFVKRHAPDNPKIQRELNLALGHHVKAGNAKGVNLCLWAGADSHKAVSDDEVSNTSEVGSSDEQFEGWSAVEHAAREGNLEILQRLRPDPGRDNFDNLYRYAKYGSTIHFLATLQPPKDLTSIFTSQLQWLACSWPWEPRRGTDTIEAILSCKVIWKEQNRDQIGNIRRLLLKLEDYNFTRILSRLKRPQVCEPETYHELIRTPTIQSRLVRVGLLK